MEKKIMVIKRDGSTEEFDQNKIAKVVKAAGLTEAQANILAEKVKNWVYDSKMEQITSQQIRSKVLEELRNVNKYASDLFEWYEKTKDNH